MTKKDKNQQPQTSENFEATGSMYHEEKTRNVQGYGDIDPNAEEQSEDLS